MENVCAVGNLRVDFARKIVFRDGDIVRLTPKAVDLLSVLVRHAGDVVSKVDLFSAVWPGTFVDESALAKLVFTLRREITALSQGGIRIETVPKRGYRLIRAEDPPATVRSAPSATASASTAERSILVLPFVNLSSDPAQEFFCDGITEDVLTSLSRVGAFRVISRTSSMMLKNSKKDLQTIARELDVQYVVEGSVQRSGDRLRVTAQLIDGRTDSHLWAERQDGLITDVFDIQDRIAQRIAQALSAEASPLRGLARPRLHDPVVIEAYLRARRMILDWSPDVLLRTVGAMESALEVVGPESLLYSGLAYLYYSCANMGIEQDEYIAKAQQSAFRALEIDPACGEAHVVLGALSQGLLANPQEAFRHLAIALERNSDDSHALLWTIIGYTVVGRTEEAERLVRRLRRVDPLTPRTRYAQVDVEVWAGRPRHTQDELTEWFRLEPQSPAARWICALHLCREGYDDAARALLRGRDMAGSDLTALMSALLYDALSGNDVTVSPVLHRAAARCPQFSYDLAEILSIAGRPTEALSWLDNAVTRGFLNFRFMCLHDPLLAPVRGEGAFDEIAARAKSGWMRIET